MHTRSLSCNSSVKTAQIECYNLDVTIRTSIFSVHVFIPEQLTDAELDIQVLYRPIDSLADFRAEAEEREGERLESHEKSGKLIFGVTNLDFCTLSSIFLNNGDGNNPDVVSQYLESVFLGFGYYMFQGELPVCPLQVI